MTNSIGNATPSFGGAVPHNASIAMPDSNISVSATTVINDHQANVGISGVDASGHAFQANISMPEDELADINTRLVRLVQRYFPGLSDAQVAIMLQNPVDVNNFPQALKMEMIALLPPGIL